jgi:hypothetical protein
MGPLCPAKANLSSTSDVCACWHSTAVSMRTNNSTKTAWVLDARGITAADKDLSAIDAGVDAENLRDLCTLPPTVHRSMMVWLPSACSLDKRRSPAWNITWAIRCFPVSMNLGYWICEQRARRCVPRRRWPSAGSQRVTPVGHECCARDRRRVAQQEQHQRGDLFCAGIAS